MLKIWIYDWLVKQALTGEVKKKLYFTMHGHMGYTSNDVQTSKAIKYCYASSSAIPMFLTGCKTEMHILKYGCE